MNVLTALRPRGMAACARDLLYARKPPSLTSVIKQLTDAETVERSVRSMQYQMRITKFPHHKGFATFDFGAVAVTKAQIEPVCSGQFTEEVHNLKLAGGTDTAKTHIAIGLGTTLTNPLIKQQAEGNSEKIIRKLSARTCQLLGE